jgi:hypothetical protein
VRLQTIKFESCSPHGKAKKAENLKFSFFLKSHKKCLKTCKFNDLRFFFILGLFSIFINPHKIKGAEGEEPFAPVISIILPEPLLCEIKLLVCLLYFW